MKRLLIKANVLTLAVILSLSTLFLQGCFYRGYKGEYPQLCSVAWNNIPTALGFSRGVEVAYDANVVVLETDDYGRVLFSYSEDRYGREANVLIMQRADDTHAYYYPDDCYIFVAFETENDTLDSKSDEIAELKRLNDWGLPLDESKCESTEIVTKKPKGELKVKDAYFEEIVRKYHENSERYVHPKNVSFGSYAKFVTSDDYGRELYIVDTTFEEYTDKTETHYWFSFLVVVHPDKSYDLSTVILLEDPRNPQADMKEIKQNNGWNTPR